MSDFLQSIVDRDPAAKSKLSIVLTYPGVKAVFFTKLLTSLQPLSLIWWQESSHSFQDS